MLHIELEYIDSFNVKRNGMFPLDDLWIPDVNKNEIVIISLGYRYKLTDASMKKLMSKLKITVKRNTVQKR